MDVGAATLFLLEFCKTKQAIENRGCPALTDDVKLNKAMSDSIGRSAYAVGQVTESALELKSFVLRKSTGSTISVYAVEFVVQPGTRLAEISSCDFAP